MIGQVNIIMEEFELEESDFESKKIEVSIVELKRLYRLVYEYEQTIRKYEKMLILENQHVGANS